LSFLSILSDLQTSRPVTRQIHAPESSPASQVEDQDAAGVAQHPHRYARRKIGERREWRRGGEPSEVAFRISCSRIAEAGEPLTLPPKISNSAIARHSIIRHRHAMTPVEIGKLNSGRNVMMRT